MSQPLRIVYNEANPPFKFQDEQGEAAGILIDLWRLWSRKTGVPVEFRVASWDETLRLLERGEVDVHAGLFATPERAERFAFSAPLFNLVYYFLTHRTILGVQRPEDLLPLRIGVPKGFSEEFLCQRLPEATPRVYADFPALYAAADRGEVRALLSPLPNLVFYLKQRGLANPYRYDPAAPAYERQYVAAVRREETELLALIDRGLLAITAEERAELETKWLGAARTDTHEVVTVAVDRGLAPFSMLDVHGNPTGVLVELWRRWGERNGRAVRFLADGSAQAVAAVVEGHADLYAGDLDEAEMAGLAKSRPLFRVPMGLYHLHLEGAGELTRREFEGTRIGALAGASRPFLGKHLPAAAEQVDYAGVAALVDALDRGEIDAFVAPKPTADLALLERGLGSRVRHLSEPLYYAELRFAATAVNGDWVKGLEQELQRIPAPEWQGILERWGVKAGGGLSIPLLAGPQLTDEERAWVAAHPRIRIAAERDRMPLEFVDGAGVHRGIVADHLALLGPMLGLNFELSGVGTRAENLRRAYAGEVDLLPLAGYTEERAQRLVFTAPYLTNPRVIVTPKGDERIHEAKDLVGRRVAVVRGAAAAERLRRLVPGAILVELENDGEALRQVALGALDATVTDPAVASHWIEQQQLGNLRIAGDFPEQDEFRMAVRGDWPLLASILDKGLEAIDEAQQREIRRRWVLVPAAPARGEARVRLSEAERQWIEQHPVIRLGIDPAFEPFEFLDEQGRHRGIAADFVERLNRRLGLHMEVVPGLGWPEVIAGVRRWEIDVLSAVGQSEERRQFLLFTRPYLTSPPMIFARNDANYIGGVEDLFGRIVAAKNGSYIHDRLKAYPHIRLLVKETTLEAMKAVANGEADAYINTLAHGAYVIEKHHLANLKVAAPLDWEADSLGFAVRKDWPELVAILNKGLAAIPAEEAAEIRRRWIGARHEFYGIDVENLRRYLRWLGGASLLILAGVGLWNYFLRREVALRQTAEAALRQAKGEAERANEAKSRFLANISHEIRNPINAIVGMCHLARQTVRDEGQREYLDSIQGAANTLLGLLNDLLDLSKIEAGKLALEKEPFEMAALLRECERIFQPAARQKDVELRIETGPGLPEWALGDVTRLRQIIWNLLSNAVKFTDQGAVTLSVHTAAPPRVRFEVRDTGPSIADEDLQRLFEPYFQTRGPGRHREGTGLGLAISRRLVQMMDGEMGCQSQSGEGSLFWFEVPLPQNPPPQAAAEPAEAPGREAVAGTPVLLAEDNPVNQKVLARLLERLGCQVTVVSDGQEAVEATQRGGFDVIFLDCQMPRMDGYEAARRIRQAGGRLENVPVVALTAHAMESDRQRCLEAGMTDYVAKPVSLDSLRAALERALGPARQMVVRGG